MTDAPPPPLPRCPCPHIQDYHDDDCPYYLAILERVRRYRENRS